MNGAIRVKTRIVAKDVPEPANGIFSNCIRVGDTIHLSGQHAGGPGGDVEGDPSMAGQTRTTLKKIQALIEAAGCTLEDVVKLTWFVVDIDKRAEASAVRREFFHGVMPCSTLVGVNALSAPGLLIEIDAICIIGAGKGAV